MSIASYYSKILDDGELLKDLTIDGKKLDLAAINIESIRKDGVSLIIRLLPHAKEHDTQELIKRYAAILPFLEAA